MNYSDFIKEMFNIYKSSTEATFGTLSMLQNQTERMANMLLNQFSTLQGETRKQVEEWINVTKKNQTELRKTYNSGMEKLAEILSSGKDEKSKR